MIINFVKSFREVQYTSRDGTLAFNIVVDCRTGCQDGIRTATLLLKPNCNSSESKKLSAIL
jgi:hypothetical protein